MSGEGAADRRAHLEMIQGVINRLGSNSFLLKGWSVLLVVGILAVASENSRAWQMAILAMLPALLFWFLDGYFLSLERRYRCLYDRVRTATEPADFDMDCAPLDVKGGTLGDGLVSFSILVFHGAIVATVLGVIYFLRTTST